MPAELQTIPIETHGSPTVRISYDARADVLFALLPGVVIDGHPEDATEDLLEGFALFRREAGGPIVGFAVDEAFGWDVLGNDEPWLWDRAFAAFAVPTLGLEPATIGEIVLAAQAALTGSTPDVVFFEMAVERGSRGDWEEAEDLWRMCLAAGDLKAHFGLGYTLVELGRPREAFGHLVTYTRITPRLAWGWAWRGRAAAAMGEVAEARRCFLRALELEAEEGEETDAAEQLGALDDAVS